MSVKGERGRLGGIGYITERKLSGGGVSGCEREVEHVLGTNGVTALAGEVSGRTDHPCKTVGGVVEEDLDLVRGGVVTGDVVLLALYGGDEVFVFNRRESVTFFSVKVDVRNKKAGFKVGAYKGGSGVAVKNGNGVSRGKERSCGGKKSSGVFEYGYGEFSDGTESYAYTDFVVRKSDERDRKTVFHEVLVEPELKRYVKATVLAGEFDHVIFYGGRVRELTDLFTKTGTGALGHFLPEVHPFGVQGVDFSSSDFDLDFRDKSETNGVYPVSTVSFGYSVTGCVKHTSSGESYSAYGFDLGKLNFKHKVGNKVTVTADRGRYFLPESNRSRAEVIVFKIFSERSITTVLGLE